MTRSQPPPVDTAAPARSPLAVCTLWDLHASVASSTRHLTSAPNALLEKRRSPLPSPPWPRRPRHGPSPCADQLPCIDARPCQEDALRVCPHAPRATRRTPACPSQPATPCTKICNTPYRQAAEASCRNREHACSPRPRRAPSRPLSSPARSTSIPANILISFAARHPSRKKTNTSMLPLTPSFPARSPRMPVHTRPLRTNRTLGCGRRQRIALEKRTPVSLSRDRGHGPNSPRLVNRPRDARDRLIRSHSRAPRAGEKSVCECLARWRTSLKLTSHGVQEPRPAISRGTMPNEIKGRRIDRGTSLPGDNVYGQCLALHRACAGLTSRDKQDLPRGDRSNVPPCPALRRPNMDPASQSSCTTSRTSRSMPGPPQTFQNATAGSKDPP